MNHVINHYYPEQFTPRIPELAEPFRNAFAGPPYHSNIPQDAALGILAEHAEKPGFEAHIAETADGRPIGAWWHDTPDMDTFRNEWGERLGELVGSLFLEHGDRPPVWVREVFVDPDFQQNGVASRLHDAFLRRLADTTAFPEGALITARMRRNNRAIMSIFLQGGAKMTPILTPAKRTNKLVHRYWYNVRERGQRLP